jgi:hypothetical protein
MLTAATHHVFRAEGIEAMGEIGFHAKKKPGF